MRIFDVVIIGGGLSGSSTALNLSRKGYSVLVIEKDEFRNRIPCAGGMASSMQQFLPFNIESVVETLVEKVHFTWNFSDDVIAELKGESPFWIINREKLDNLILMKAKGLSVQTINSLTVTELVKEGSNWIIKCINNNTFQSKFLVIADGSSSEWSARLKLGPRKPKFAKTIAIRMDGTGTIDKQSVRFDFGVIKYGFAWAFPRKESTNIGLGTFLGHSKSINKKNISGILEGLGFNNDSFDLIEKDLRIWNGIHNLHQDGALVVGDAASICDPFLAEGIRPSLISSFYAAECIHDCFSKNSQDLSNYSEKMSKEWGQSMVWGKRIAEVFYRFPKTGYKLGVKRKTAPQRIAQILSGQMNYSDIARRVIKRLLLNR